jgi:hypothetical protein
MYIIIPVQSQQDRQLSSVFRLMPPRLENLFFYHFQANVSTEITEEAK